jgi:hypothetical protein
MAFTPYFLTVLFLLPFLLGGGGELRQFVRQLYSGPMCTYLYAMLLKM